MRSAASAAVEPSLPAKSPSAFSETQLSDLGRLGVGREQIDQLSTVVRLWAASVHTPAKMQDVRDTMGDLHDSLLQAQRAVLTVLRAHTPASAAVKGLVTLAERGPVEEEIEDYDALAKAQNALTIALRVMARAKLSVPGTQSRRSAFLSVTAVRWIDTALREGWRVNQSLAGTHTSAAPAYPFAPSLGRAQPFREVVALCCGAMHGDWQIDAERAIKAYMRERKLLLLHPQPARPPLQVKVRFRRLGQGDWTTADGEPDLPSR